MTLARLLQAIRWSGDQKPHDDDDEGDAICKHCVLNGGAQAGESVDRWWLSSEPRSVCALCDRYGFGFGDLCGGWVAHRILNDETL